jgi:membrane protease subunit HflK
LVELRFAVHYRVDDAVAFVTQAADIEGLIRDAARSAAVEVAAASKLEIIYNVGRDEVSRAILENARQTVRGYGAGIDLRGVYLTYVHAPSEVHYDFRDYASALHDQRTAVYQGEAQAVSVVNVAAASDPLTLLPRRKPFRMRCRWAP